MSWKLIEQYRERAEASRIAAEAAILDNVRERHLESADTWSALARRAARVEVQREQMIADKKAEREAAAVIEAERLEANEALEPAVA